MIRPHSASLSLNQSQLYPVQKKKKFDSILHWCSNYSDILFAIFSQAELGTQLNILCVNKSFNLISSNAIVCCKIEYYKDLNVTEIKNYVNRVHQLFASSIQLKFFEQEKTCPTWPGTKQLEDCLDYRSTSIVWKKLAEGIGEQRQSLTDFQLFDNYPGRDSEFSVWFENNAFRFGGLKLNLSEKKLSMINNEIFRLTALQELDLGGNFLNSLPFGISKLVNLTKLLLNDNHFDSVPKEIFTSASLIQLDLDGNRLTSLPGEISELTALQFLDLRANLISSLPLEIGMLYNLTHLNLGECLLDSLPISFGWLAALTSLCLNSNNLILFSLEICNLQNLTTLDLKDNKLAKLPETINRLTALTQLDLECNLLNYLPEEICELTALETLLLSENNLEFLPDFFFQLTNLVSLDLRANELSFLPSSIEKCVDLSFLNIAENELSSLPAEIAQLTNLTRLCLFENKSIFDSFSAALLDANLQIDL